MIIKQRGGVSMDKEEISMLAERLKKEVEKRHCLKHFSNKISIKKAEQYIRMYLENDLKEEKQKEIEFILENKKGRSKMSQEKERNILSKSGERQIEALISNFEEILEQILDLCEIIERLENNKECIPQIIKENLNYCIETGNCDNIQLDGLNAIAEDLKTEIKRLKKRIGKELEHSENGYNLKKDLGL